MTFFKKKPQRNGYWMLVEDLRESKRRGNADLDWEKPEDLAIRVWANCGDDMQEKYKSKAKEMKKTDVSEDADTSPFNRAERLEWLEDYIHQGVPAAHTSNQPVIKPAQLPTAVHIESDQRIINLKAVEDYLNWNFPPICKDKHAALLDHEFNFFSLQIYTKNVTEGLFFPCEIGAVRMTLRSGIVDSYSCVINDDHIPKTEACLFSAWSRRTDNVHGVPPSSYLERWETIADVVPEFTDPGLACEELYRFLRVKRGGFLYAPVRDVPAALYALRFMETVSEYNKEHLPPKEFLFKPTNLIGVEDLACSLIKFMPSLIKSEGNNSCAGEFTQMSSESFFAESRMLDNRPEFSCKYHAEIDASHPRVEGPYQCALRTARITAEVFRYLLHTFGFLPPGAFDARYDFSVMDQESHYQSSGRSVTSCAESFRSRLSLQTPTPSSIIDRVSARESIIPGYEENVSAYGVPSVANPFLQAALWGNRHVANTKEN